MSLDTNLVEEDVTLSSFRKRNNIIVLILILFIISLILIIGSSTFYILHNFSQSNPPIPLNNPALRAYCSAACNTLSRINILNAIVATKSITNPNQIFTISLQTAAKELENLSSFMLSNSHTQHAFKNCSGSLRAGLGQIRAALAAMRIDPSHEQRSEVMNRIVTAEVNIKSCIDDLTETESTAVIEARTKVLGVKEYVSSGGDFLWMYDDVMQRFRSDVSAAQDWRIMSIGYLVIACVCGLYLWFVFYFFRALCRFVGVKYFTNSNAFQACLAGKVVSRR